MARSKLKLKVEVDDEIISKRTAELVAEMIQEFYSVPENVAKFKEWKKRKEKNIEQKEI